MDIYIFRGIPRRDNDHGYVIARQWHGFGEKNPPTLSSFVRNIDMNKNGMASCYKDVLQKDQV